MPMASNVDALDQAKHICECIASACGWDLADASEIYVQEQQMERGQLYELDWRDYWGNALDVATRGLVFLDKPDMTANMRWEFEQMRDNFAPERVVYVILDCAGACPEQSANFLRAAAQQSLVIDCRTTRPAEIGRIFASMDWTSAALQQPAPELFVFPENSSSLSLHVQAINVPATSVPKCGGNAVRHVATLDGVLSSSECAQLVAEGEALGFQAAPICACNEPDDSGAKPVDQSRRKHKRVAKVDDAFASRLMERVRPCVPAQLADGGKLVGLNPLLRWLRYDPGDFVAVHKDGAYVAPNGDRSAITILLYLSAMDSGGETCFYDSWKQVGASAPCVVVSPECGKVCLMPQDVLHEGRTHTSSSPKFVIRTEVMYSPAP